MTEPRGPGGPVASVPQSLVDYLWYAADHVDRCMSGQEHSSAISRWSAVLSRAMGLDPVTAWRLELAGRLHDIGKIVVPAEILGKREGLTAGEWRLLREHPEHGARMARLVPGLDGVAELIRQHHERFDGTGYPDGLRGAEISMESRIIAVCDSWAAMRSDRAYQPALAEDRARDQLRTGRGSQFDPELVDLFLDLQGAGRLGDLDRLPEPRAVPPVAPAGRPVGRPARGHGSALAAAAGS
jgi:HD-GYP domain-containing protein (c-di-GMP phosphodiesterase class II)